MCKCLLVNDGRVGRSELFRSTLSGARGASGQSKKPDETAVSKVFSPRGYVEW